MAFFQLKDESGQGSRLDSMEDDEDESNDEDQEIDKLNKSIQQSKGGLKKNAKSFSFTPDQLDILNQN